MGRPPKPRQERRETILRVRLLEDEARTITECANELGLTVAQFVREAVLAGSGPARGRRSVNADIARLVTVLSPIGSNLNQLARALHSSGHLPRHPSLDEACRSVVDALKTLRDDGR